MNKLGNWFRVGQIMFCIGIILEISDLFLPKGVARETLFNIASIFAFIGGGNMFLVGTKLDFKGN